MAKNKKNVKALSAAEILLPYVHAHLAEVSREIVNVQDELLQLEISPDRSNEADVAGRIFFLGNILRQHICYTGRIMDDVHSVIFGRESKS